MTLSDQSKIATATTNRWPKSKIERINFRRKYAEEGHLAYLNEKPFTANPHRKNSKAYYYWALAYVQSCSVLKLYIEATKLKRMAINKDVIELTTSMEKTFQKYDLKAMRNWYLAN